MAEKKIKWTPQQQRAIKQRGSDVLVTASAGTGKTAVLSGRCVDIVSDGNICPDIRSILVLTFTDAAAEQMRSRIEEQLQTVFLESGNAHLRRQIVLLQGADISTIHSFCKRLITEHFYDGKLGLDPTFRVIGQDEQALLKAEILEKTIDWAWQQGNLVQGLKELFYRRDLRTNDGFTAKIIQISDFLDSVVSRQNWYERAAALAESANPYAGDLAEKQRQIVAEKLQHILDRLLHAREICKSSDAGGDWDAKFLKSHIEPVEKCVELLKTGDWEKFADAIRNFKNPKTPTPKIENENIAHLIHDTAKQAIDDVAKLEELAVLNPDYLDKLSGSVGLQTKVLLGLVGKFDQLYGRAKGAINSMDFADLEHYALKLLTEEDQQSGELKPTETSLALRRKYKYIFVDEYQDINPVQRAILKAVSGRDNVFVVGDVKQSIYAFRGAEPGIFIKDLQSASSDPKETAGGLRVDLNANFRSDKGILDFVNKVFGRIMTASFAGIDYDESAELKPAAQSESSKAAENEKQVVELHILDEEPKDTEEETQAGNNAAAAQDDYADTAGDNQYEKIVISSRQRQASAIALRIRQMVGSKTGRPEFVIYDKHLGKFRDVEYGDIVILMRSPADRAGDYVEILRLAGVPVSCQNSVGYFEETEISDCLCLLKVLDNPQRDIEMAAVLRSPFFGISDSDLVKIKINGEKSVRADKDEDGENFYGLVRRYSQSGPDAELADRLKEILTQIEDWRTAARRGDLADLIWQIYRQTGFLSFVSALPNGQARRANLLRLHDRAVQFAGFVSSGGVPSLSRFVEFIEKLRRTGQDWSAAEPEAQAENAVRIISVHKSKGLEFPVVFLAETNSPFNKKDIYNNDCITDAEDTVGLRIIERQSNSRFDSLAYQVIAEGKLKTNLAEEMRILYVATTRARERLILTAAQKKKHCREILAGGFFNGGQPIPDWQLRRCRRPIEWILYGLCGQKKLHGSFETGLAEQTADDGLFSLSVYNQDELKKLNDFIIEQKIGRQGRSVVKAETSRQGKTGSELFLPLKESLAWRYRFGDAPLLAAKTSVSQMTHGNDEYVKFDYAKSLERRPKAVEADSAVVVEGRLIGAAVHLVIAGVDLAWPINGDAIEKIKKGLLAKGAMTEAAAECIDADSIVLFFESELGKKATDSNNKVLREWPFSFAVPASVIRDSNNESQETSDEIVIVQGIIDMLIQTPAGLMIIDFKTDNITAGDVQRRAELYRRQLELYGRAAEAILKTKLLGKWLYFLRPGCAVEIKD